MLPYRVFVKRTYIAVEWFDVMADSPAQAEAKAKLAANKLRPDPRTEATDNGWLADGDALQVSELGARAYGAPAMHEVAKDVYQVAPEPPDLLAALEGLTETGRTPDGSVIVGPVGWGLAQQAIKEASHQTVTTG